MTTSVIIVPADKRSLDSKSAVLSQTCRLSFWLILCQGVSPKHIILWLLNDWQFSLAMQNYNFCSPDSTLSKAEIIAFISVSLKLAVQSQNVPPVVDIQKGMTRISSPTVGTALWGFIPPFRTFRRTHTILQQHHAAGALLSSQILALPRCRAQQVPSSVY